MDKQLEKSYTIEEVLASSKIGFEFEFLTNLDPLKVARKLSDLL